MTRRVPRYSPRNSPIGLRCGIWSQRILRTARNGTASSVPGMPQIQPANDTARKMTSGVYHPVRSVDVVLGNEFPQVVEVRCRSWVKSELIHAGPDRRRALFSRKCISMLIRLECSYGLCQIGFCSRKTGDFGTEPSKRCWVAEFSLPGF